MSALLRTPHLEPRVLRIDGRDVEVLVPSFSTSARVELSSASTAREWIKPGDIVEVGVVFVGGGGGGGAGSAGQVYGLGGAGGAGGTVGWGSAASGGPR